MNVWHRVLWINLQNVNRNLKKATKLCRSTPRKCVLLTKIINKSKCVLLYSLSCSLQPYSLLIENWVLFEHPKNYIIWYKAYFIYICLGLVFLLVQPKLAGYWFLSVREQQTDNFAFGLCLVPFQLICMSDSVWPVYGFTVASNWLVWDIWRRAYVGVRIRREAAGIIDYRIYCAHSTHVLRSLYVCSNRSTAFKRRSLSLSHSSPRNSCLSYWRVLFLSQRCWKHDGKCISARERERAMSEWCARRSAQTQFPISSLIFHRLHSRAPQRTFEDSYY
jgi:hypothetical protein